MSDNDVRGISPDKRSTSLHDRGVVTKAPAKKAAKKTAAKSATPSTRAPVRPHELDVLGMYRSYWAGRSNTEKFQAALPREERIRRGIKHLDREWYPDTEDFHRVEAAGKAKQSVVKRMATPEALVGMLGEIGSKNPGTVSRVNIFAHGNNEGDFALSGRVSENNVLWSEADLQGAAFAEKFFAEANDPLTVYWGTGKSGHSLAEARQAFSKDGVVVVYACHSAINSVDLVRLSGALGVPVAGFNKELVFKVDQTKSGDLSIELGIDGVPESFERDFHQLDRYLKVVRAAPASKGLSR
ncbi:hypothetical protein [Variovorax sp. dw_308]|uniref:hypothetical protein n=1 Tax=Variovorax sp. dw_308 TaxID=2721546 RepID=UPI001C478F39|nr:hypothetical protein [Variovorax sp. dw_308]